MRSLVKNLFIILFISSTLFFSGCSTRFSPVGSVITEEDRVIEKYVLDRFQKKMTTTSDEVKPHISPENYVYGSESLLVGSGKGELKYTESRIIIDAFGEMELPLWLRNNNLYKIADKFDTSIGSFYRLHFDRGNYKIKKNLFSNFMGTGSSSSVDDDDISYRRTNVIFYLNWGNEDEKPKVVWVDKPLIVDVAKNQAEDGLFFIDAVKIPGLKSEGLILYQTIPGVLDKKTYRFYYYDFANGKTKIRWSSFSNKTS